MAVLLSPSVDVEGVRLRIASELRVAKDLADPKDEWSWNDLAKTLQTIPGVTVTQIERGPVWDAN